MAKYATRWLRGRPRLRPAHLIRVMPAEECICVIQPPATRRRFCLLAVVLANGDLNPPKDMPARLAAAGLVVAADGGSRHCRTLDLLPDIVVGDLDSLDSEARAELEAQGVQFVSHPADKDQTDLELALLHAKQVGALEILVLAGLGRRWDHTFANLLLAAHTQFSGQRILFLDGEQRLFVIRGPVRLDARMGERVSLLPLGGDADGVSTRGLQYPLNLETLTFGSSRGISNVVLTEGAEVDIVAGCLLCVISPAELV